MKKSLMLIGFAFIFLLSVSIVSAGFRDWLTGGTGDDLNNQKTYRSGVSSTLTKRPLPGMERRGPTATLPPSSMLNCPPNWDAKSARDGGGYCVQKGRSLGDDKLDPTAATCVTTCGEATCTSYGAAPAGWCCICTSYEQTCVTECTEDPIDIEIVVEV